MLNHDYVFETMAPEDTRRAFTVAFGVHRVLLDARTRLYKLTSHPMVGSRGVTPWWHFLDTTTVRLGNGAPFQADGFAVARERAARLGVSNRDFGRARAAVSLPWNEMKNVLAVALNQPTYAFFGRNSGMPVDVDAADASSVMFIGGAFQLFIPDLKQHHVRLIASG